MEEKPKLWSPKEGERGMTALHYAAYCQDLTRVVECVEGGFDVHQKDATGYTPLAWCVDMAATGDVGAAESIIDYLVAHGARLEFSDDRYPGIVEFARACDESVAQHIEKLLAK
jgi:ankyrin repeat protein